MHATLIVVTPLRFPCEDLRAASMEDTVFRSSLLGPIREPAVTVAIDVSASMYPLLGQVQLGVRKWLQTCCRSPFTPPKVNLVAIGDLASSWQHGVTQLTPETFSSVSDWLASVKCSGSSCKLSDGLELMISDPCSQAVYFITDGFPNTDPVSSSEILQKLTKWNRMAQPVHVVVVNKAEDVADERKLTEIKTAWLGASVGPQTTTSKSNETMSGKSLLTAMARQTLGTIRHVTIPSPRLQGQVPHATVIANFHPGKSHQQDGTSTSAPHAFSSSIPATQSNPVQEPPAASTFTTGQYSSSASSSTYAFGVSLHPTESLLGRFVVADYMKGLQVLALKQNEGVYKMGRIVEAVSFFTSVKQVR